MTDNIHSADEWVIDFKLTADAIDNCFIIHAMKTHGLTRITENQADLVKACYLLHEDGLQLTTPMLSAVTGKCPVSILQTMHGLGDKRILYLLGNDRQRLVWEMAPHFHEVLKDVLANAN